MEYISGENIKISHETAVTIGKFDGLHVGHLFLLEELKKTAKKRGIATVVLSFSPHPIAFFTGRPVPLILTASEKIYLLEQMGIDYFVEYPFTAAFAQKSPEDFANDVLFGRLNCRALVVSEDFRFGKGGAGDVSLVEKLGSHLGFSLNVLPHVSQNGEKVSSGHIRRFIAEGNFAKAKEAMGRDYFIMGQITDSGLLTEKDKILPPNGEYLAIIHGEKEFFRSVVRIDEKTAWIENCGDLSGETVRIIFIGNA